MSIDRDAKATEARAAAATGSGLQLELCDPHRVAAGGLPEASEDGSYQI